MYLEKMGSRLPGIPNRINVEQNRNFAFLLQNILKTSDSKLSLRSCVLVEGGYRKIGCRVCADQWTDRPGESGLRAAFERRLGDDWTVQLHLQDKSVTRGKLQNYLGFTEHWIRCEGLSQERNR